MMERHPQGYLSRKVFITQIQIRTWGELENASIQALCLSSETNSYLHKAGFRKIGELLQPTPTQRTLALTIPYENRQEIVRQAKWAIGRWQKYFTQEKIQALQAFKSLEATTAISPLAVLTADDIYAVLYPAHAPQPSYQLIRIEALHLPSRAYNALLRYKITTVGQLANLSEEQIGLIPGIGPKSVEEIRQVLGRYINDPTLRILTERPLADLPVIAEFAETPLLVLQLPTWIYTRFKMSQITTVGQLAALTDTQLGKLGRARHLSEQRLATVKASLTAYLHQHSRQPEDRPDAFSDSSTVQEDTEARETDTVISQPAPTLLQQQEAELRQALVGLKFIGELPIHETKFYAMCQIVQAEAMTGAGIPNPQNVPAALFVTLMVFTARFAQVEGRNFWTPYAELVWGLPEADPTFQNECRQYFATAVHELEQAFPKLLPFTQTSDGDVVRPIYRHAILPAYLKDDFIHWLQKEWPNILDIPAENLAEALQSDRHVQSQPRPLAEFLQSEETTETAVALVMQLADGIRQVQSGQPPTTMDEQWPPHTLLHTLWQAVSSHLQTATTTAAVRMGRGKLEWVWDLEENDLYLRLRNLILLKEPQKLIWDDADVELYANPWQLDSGQWWLDELLLLPESPAITGGLIVLDAADEILARLNVPPLPVQPWLSFRPEPGRDTAVLNTEIIESGQYLISTTEDAALRGKVTQQDRLPLPHLLRTVAGHQKAGLYHLNLPVAVWQGAAQIAEFALNEEVVRERPCLTNNHLLTGSSPRLPAVYQNTAVQLILPTPTSDTVLWLKMGQETRKIPLNPQLSSAQLTIDLQPYLLPTPATYSLQLRQGLRPLLKEPLEFTTLPGIQISPPSPNRVYSPSLPPQCTLRGLTPENILFNPRYHYKVRPDGAILLTWIDLREDDCRLNLQFGEQTIQLGWPLPQRIFSWLEPTPSHGFVRESDLAKTTIYLIAPNEKKYPQGRTYKYSEVWIAGAEQDTRRIEFRKRRHLSKVVIQPGDPVHDMIREYIRRHPGQPARVQVRLYQDEWTLLEVHPQPQINQAAVNYRPEQQIIHFACDVNTPWEGAITFALYDLHQPFASPKTWHFERLETNHELPLVIPDSAYDYLLTIQCDGQRLQLPQILRLTRGIKAAYHTKDIALLLDYLQGHLQGAISSKCSVDFIRLMIQQTTSEVPFAPNRKQLYQFATLANVGHIKSLPEELERLWPGLHRLQLVHDIDAWHDQYGLLPTWAILDQPMRLQLQRHPKVILRVFPEKVLQQGKWGIGYAYLKLERNQKEKVYVSWRPYYEHYIQVKVGRPPANDILLSEMDTQELRIIRQCSHCGRFIKMETPELQAEHSRCLKYYDARFKSVTEKKNLVATFRFEQAHLQHRSHQSSYIDQQRIALLWRQEEDQIILDDPNPISQAAYQYAAAQWVRRYHVDAQYQELFEQLINYRRHSFDQFAEHLEEFQIPAFQAAARFLLAFRTSEPPLHLDRILLLLALLLRTQAHHPEQLSGLLQVIRLKVSNLEQLLVMAENLCPELLLWALTWAELFFVHALIKGKK